jgi:hypothetical protein
VLFVDRATASTTIEEADRRAHALLERWRQRHSSWSRRLVAGTGIESASQAFGSELEAWRAKARQLLTSWKRTGLHTERLFDLVLAVPGADELAEAHVVRAGSARAGAYEQLTEAAHLFTAALAEKRADAVARLRTAFDAIQEYVAETLDPFVETLEAADKRYRDEMRKAGK